MGISIQMYRQRIGLFRHSGHIIFTEDRIDGKSQKLSFKSLFIWTFFFVIFTSVQFSTSRTDFMCFSVSSSVSSFKTTSLLNDTEYLSLGYSKIRVDIIENNFSTVGLSWSYSCPSHNKLCHSLCGNRRIGYSIAFWNCRRKLLSDGSETCGY